LIRQLTQDGTTVVVSTHVMAEADRCDRLALLAEGRCIAVGTPHELCDRTGLRILRIQTVDWQTTYERVKERWPEATLHGTAIHLPDP
jgi:ABC-type multidrug transport system ATPase subunit